MSWLVSVPVFSNATDPTAEFDVSAAGLVSANDIDTLVVFRDGFNVANGNGTNIVLPAPLAATIISGAASKTITLPQPSGALVDNVLTLPYGAGEIRLQHAAIRNSEFARLLDHPASGAEHASAWVSVTPGAKLTLGGSSAGHSVTVQGASQPINLTLSQ